MTFTVNTSSRLILVPSDVKILADDCVYLGRSWGLTLKFIVDFVKIQRVVLGASANSSPPQCHSRVVPLRRGVAGNYSSGGRSKKYRRLIFTITAQAVNPLYFLIGFL